MPRGPKGERRPPRKKSTKARKPAGGSTGAVLTPLAYLLHVMRDPTAPAEMRFEAAKAAAPLVHPTLAKTTHEAK
jgi:hypothetical protein